MCLQHVATFYKAIGLLRSKIGLSKFETLLVFTALSGGISAQVLRFIEFQGGLRMNLNFVDTNPEGRFKLSLFVHECNSYHFMSRHTIQST